MLAGYIIRQSAKSRCLKAPYFDGKSVGDSAPSIVAPGYRKSPAEVIPPIVIRIHVYTYLLAI